ncbi:MAG: FecR family protein [Candidatus Marinimicrobia bacterium]|jgi:hypothetical protein|nr:FecR family protein [Candidatus Neomarinimicrobiota bacterium]MDP6612119.1 FecR family protein [Candidatus Neomarinimicrobiota bacterium]|tara:strand:+ start:1800 stop:2471 length:672 start_codon:yes stop_codon:yes gene_type:complete
MTSAKKIISSLLFLTMVFGGDRIAITTKVIGSVQYIRGNKGSKVLKKGHIIESGDILKTNKDGFAALLFIDDKSALKIKENSELIITGKRGARAIAKKINMAGGTIRAQVGKQKKGGFTVQTSVSVASVKGTDFWLIADKNTGDSVIGLEGTIMLLNQLSGDSLDVTSGLTGLSLPSGSVQSFKTDPKTIPEDPTGGQTGEQQLKIEFQDASGKKKTLIIEYK